MTDDNIITGETTDDNIMRDTLSVVTSFGIPVEAGSYQGKPGETWGTITPITQVYDIYCDNRPEVRVEHARLELFFTGNFLGRLNDVKSAIMNADITITDSGYIEQESETGYQHIYVDVCKDYQL